MELVKVTMRLRKDNVKKLEVLKKHAKTKLHPKGSKDEITRRAIDAYNPNDNN